MTFVRRDKEHLEGLSRELQDKLERLKFHMRILFEIPTSDEVANHSLDQIQYLGSLISDVAQDLDEQCIVFAGGDPDEN